jgi:hypothetical protein
MPTIASLLGTLLTSPTAASASGVLMSFLAAPATASALTLSMPVHGACPLPPVATPVLR